MAGTTTTSSRRRRVAEEALAALGATRADHQLLSIQCSHAHHVAAVYDTSSGTVYVAVTGPHAHGAKDFVDTAHHGGRRGTEYVAPLPLAGRGPETLPGWCDCGPRAVPRDAVLEALRTRTRTLHLP